MLKNAEGADFVTDGLVREFDGIEAVGLALMCCGVALNSPFDKASGEIGLFIQFAGVSVNSGDMIVSDRRGVAVVPFERMDEVIVALARIRALEEAMDAEVAQGLKLPEKFKSMMQTDQVRRV
ncbi:MAG: 4-hydroxy-4-methyl-2-oxoglutarate aldolase [Granulosicoccus sp.]|jgi:4-hydroxy-4-methyl-2-oxoglutarate aldolase